MDTHHLLLDHYVRAVAAEREADGARNRLVRDHLADRRRQRWAAATGLVRRVVTRPLARPALTEQACCA